jgi:hypothetical protein
VPAHRENLCRRFAVGEVMENAGDFLSVLVAFPAQKDRIAGFRIANRPFDGTDPIGVTPHTQPL